MNETFPEELKSWLVLFVELLPDDEREAVLSAFTEMSHGASVARRWHKNRSTVLRTRERGLQRMRPWVEALAAAMTDFLDNEEP